MEFGLVHVLFAGFLMEKRAVLPFCRVVFLQIEGVDRRIFWKKEGGQAKKRFVPLCCLRFFSLLMG